MFQFRRFPSYTYVFSAWWLDMTPAGLLHSDICGLQPTYGSPQLFAVCCVLRRLLVPRHSPCALCSLTTMWYFWFFFEYCSIISYYLKSCFCSKCFTRNILFVSLKPRTTPSFSACATRISSKKRTQFVVYFYTHYILLWLFLFDFQGAILNFY